MKKLDFVNQGLQPFDRVDANQTILKTVALVYLPLPFPYPLQVPLEERLQKCRYFILGGYPGPRFIPQYFLHESHRISVIWAYGLWIMKECILESCIFTILSSIFERLQHLRARLEFAPELSAVNSCRAPEILLNSSVPLFSCRK